MIIFLSLVFRFLFLRHHLHVGFSNVWPLMLCSSLLTWFLWGLLLAASMSTHMLTASKSIFPVSPLLYIQKSYILGLLHIFIRVFYQHLECSVFKNSLTIFPHLFLLFHSPHCWTYFDTSKSETVVPSLYFHCHPAQLIPSYPLNVSWICHPLSVHCHCS